ncbi:MAG TPA: LPS assembly lipoprotein LptE [Longimicrobium sp.]|nr:LPS assembly lipoprotein LptE [Longimicrobium sp.]
MYSLTGGGLPPNIRTVYVDYFENTTPYEILRGDVQRELQQELPRSLGVRLAPQTNADAVVRGKLTSYDEATVNIDPNTSPGGRITAEQRRVQITFDAEIYDVKQDKVIWTGSSISAIGNFGRGESVDVGRERAVREIIQKIVEGAQSQW